MVRRRRKRARRNAWKEKPIVRVFKGAGTSWSIHKAPGHHKAALKGWSKRGKKKSAAKARVPKKRYSTRKSATATGRAIARYKRNPRKRRASPRKRARRVTHRKRRKSSHRKRRAAPRRKRRASRRRRSVKRNRRSGGRRRHRRVTHKRNRRSSHRKSHRKHRRNRRRSRRNPFSASGLMAFLPKVGVAALAIGAAAYGGHMLGNYLADKLPESVKEYAPAAFTAAVAGGLYWAAKKFGMPDKFMNAVIYGGAAASVFQLVAHIRVNTAMGQQSLAQYLGLPFTSTPVALPAPPADQSAGGVKVGSYGVFGYNPVQGLGRMGDYGVFGLGSHSIDVDGRPLAVEGVVKVPGGGALAIEGGLGYIGSTLSDTVVGTQSPSYGPAVNPFAPGLREGQRGTMNEPHAAEVADMGSLAGNIFSGTGSV